MDGKKCGECKFWSGAASLECIRFPPQKYQIGYPPMFPTVFHTTRACGEFVSVVVAETKKPLPVVETTIDLEAEYAKNEAETQLTILRLLAEEPNRTLTQIASRLSLPIAQVLRCIAPSSLSSFIKRETLNGESLYSITNKGWDELRAKLNKPS
jgi:hypothetical protein